MMPTAWALVSSEAIKLRRSALVRLAIAAPALLFLLELLTMFGRRHIELTDPALLWRDLLSFGWIMWLGLFTPVRGRRLRRFRVLALKLCTLHCRAAYTQAL